MASYNPTSTLPVGDDTKMNGARVRTNSAMFLDNKDFAYLLSDDESDANAASPTIQITPALRGNGNNKKANKKQQYGFRKPRTSSIQVETTKNKQQQMSAIKKEVQILCSEVPHFSDIYLTTQQQWAKSKRDKGETETFALIQGLTEWIHEYGKTAVNQYDDFKSSAEQEILSMVTKMDKITRENSKLTLIIEESQHEKENLVKKVQENEQMLQNYEKQQKFANDDTQRAEMDSMTIRNLEDELESIRKKNKALKDKYDRVEKYWKMTQDENEELSQKNKHLEEEVISVQEALRANNANIDKMKANYQETVQNLQVEHQSYAERMRAEQEKLIQASHEANEAAVGNMDMAPTQTLYDMADDEDFGNNDYGDDGDEYVDDLENDINVYEYEDDEWLDESESLSGSHGGDMDEKDIEEEEEEEVEDKTVDFEMQRLFLEEFTIRKDVTLTFVYEKTFIHSDADNKTMQFESSHTATTQQQQKQKEPKPLTPKKEKEPMQFETQKIKMEQMDQRKEKVQTTQFESVKTSQSVKQLPQKKEEPKKAEKTMEFSASSTGTIGQKNKLIPKPIKPLYGKPKTSLIYSSNASAPKTGGNAFMQKLAMFKHLEETKGGKPQVLDHDFRRAAIRDWKTANKGMKDTVLNKINIESKNVHVTKSTIPDINASAKRGKQINVLKITKTRAHTLKPRLFGYMNIVKSSFIPRWKATQQPRYFFVLDGLPSQTNTNEKEPDFAKNRKHDFLVPTLFFFQDKDDYDTFYAQVGKEATRSIKFQKTFAKYAKGIYPLNRFALEQSILSCTKRLCKLMKRTIIKLPNSEINECGTVNDCTILVCDSKEVHRFACNDAIAAKKWVKKVNKLVDKRADRLVNINNGLLGVHQMQNQRNSFLMDDNDTLSAGARGHKPMPSFIGPVPTSPLKAVRGTRASLYKLSGATKVESNFD